jgi:hypothetical protein
LRFLSNGIITFRPQYLLSKSGELNIGQLDLIPFGSVAIFAKELEIPSGTAATLRNRNNVVVLDVSIRATLRTCSFVALPYEHPNIVRDLDSAVFARIASCILQPQPLDPPAFPINSVSD